MSPAPQPRTRPDAVIFDMDGLMLDTESLGARTWERAARMAGVHGIAPGRALVFWGGTLYGCAFGS